MTGPKLDDVPVLYQVRPRNFPEGEGWREVSRRNFDDYGDFPGYPDAEWERRKLYAEPAPASATDLGQFRATVERAWKASRAGSEDDLSLGKLLALIDGQAKLQASLNEQFGNPEELAPAIDLEQFREAVEALHAANIAQELAREPGYPSIQFQRTAQKCSDLMDLIDGQSNVRSSSEHNSEVATDPVTDDAVRRLVRAMENTPGDELLDPNTRLCRRLLAAALQPAKGEGVADD